MVQSSALFEVAVQHSCYIENKMTVAVRETLRCGMMIHHPHVHSGDQPYMDLDIQSQINTDY